MKTSFLSTALVSLALLSVHTVVADFSLGAFPEVVHAAETYTLSWTATANYSYAIWLIHDSAIDDNNYDWTKVSTLGADLHFNSLNISFPWTVPSNLSSQSNYALWLDAFTIPFNGASYTGQTNWFTVGSSSEPSNSANPSATNSATSTGPASTASSGVPSSAHHKSISGGAIAGIVIGCLIILAIVVGGFLLAARRKRQSGIKKREAAARANRLAPVMQGDSAAYEMHGRAPGGTKETNI